jgi:hydrogenase-4 component B
MLVVALMLASMACWITAGLLGLLADQDRVPMALGVLGSVLAMAGALAVLLGGPAATFSFRFWGVWATLEVDALSAAFLLPLHLVAGLGIIYGKGYWPLDAPKGTGRWVRAGFGVLAAAMTLVFTARQGVLFLVAWEVMAMSAMLLMATEHERPEVMRGTWIYLACTHVGTVLLTLMVILLAQRLGGFGWYPTSPFPQRVPDWVILVLALAGFGFKAGLVPLHFWLPSAHAGSPSHVSAILSAVMLKAGVYGVLRVSGLLPPVPHLGAAVMALGAATALYGVGCALAQRDYKRLLAYSSVENIGIIFMGIGLGWTGRSLHNPWITALGFGSAIFHVWNHATFKSLLFFGAGSVLHATGTRDMERLGGLASRMPRTALALFPAVLAVSALPPFNGFVSEWLLYRGFFAAILGGGSWSEGLALTALAVTGGLAGVAFAKFFGFVFLGIARSPEAEHAHDPGPQMELPMAALACLCLALSLGSVLLLPLLDRVLAVLAPGDAPQLALGLGRDLSVLAGLSVLLLTLGAGALVWVRRTGRSTAPAPGTWDCGYVRPTTRMQYSASSFADGWGEVIPGLRSRIRRIRTLFPRAIGFHSQFQDVIGEGVVAPRTDRLALRLLRYRRLQQGQLPMYLLYILITLVVVFLWLIIRPRLLG